MRFLVSGIVASVFALGMGTEAGASSDLEALRARAQAYWQARVERSPDLSQFSLPEDKGGPRRKVNTKRPNVDIEAATIDEIEITDDAGTVHVSLEIGDYHFRMSPRMAAALRENELARTKRVRQDWVRVEGEWYRGKTLLLDGFFKALSQRRNRSAPISGADKGSSGVVTSGGDSVRSAEN